ncbi:hypothetical protein pipiens_008239 [Culex pipiens pipiens]|uniref:C-type lectin domain-containing protein n=1 Tax=Culex pipiens pipiens TaxID=38569 RepID=A0ABD1DI51_CULPP
MNFHHHVLQGNFLVLVATFSVALVFCNPTPQSDDGITYGAEVNGQDLERAAFANQQRYVVFNNKRSTFFEAWRACMSLGLRLATVNSSEDDAALLVALRDAGTHHKGPWFIAGTDLGKEGSFVWLTTNREVGHGSGFITMFSKVTCLVLVAIFSVALVFCNPTPQSEDSITYGAEVNGQDVQRAAFANQQRYVVFNNKRSTFFEAWRACMSLGLRLATVNSSEDDAALLVALRDAGTHHKGPWFIAGPDLGKEALTHPFRAGKAAGQIDSSEASVEIEIGTRLGPLEKRLWQMAPLAGCFPD